MEKDEMRIGVISDTHGVKKAMDRVILDAGKVDLWLHAGDYSQDAPYLEAKTGVPVYAVCGNCDVYEDRGPVELVTKLEGTTLAMVHGNRYVSRSRWDNLIYWGQEKNAQVVVFGHIHTPVNEVIDGILVINPGSAAKPRGDVPTYGILTLEKGRAPFFEVRELAKEPERTLGPFAVKGPRPLGKGGIPYGRYGKNQCRSPGASQEIPWEAGSALQGAP